MQSVIDKLNKQILMLEMDVAAREDMLKQSESQKKSSQSEFLQAMLAKDQVLSDIHSKFLGIQKLENDKA